MFKANQIATKSYQQFIQVPRLRGPSFQKHQLAKRKFTQQEKPIFEFKENPIIFNKINEQYVIRGKERVVGLWLLSVSASVFGLVTLGGYTRLSKSGLSMTKWQPHKILPPTTQEAWEKEFEEYKQFPEYYKVNKERGMDLNGFKTIYYVEWAHRVLGRTIGLIFFGPMMYFFARGYIQPKLRNNLIGLLALGGFQGAVGWWMVKSGLVDKEKTKELDKTPRVNPYRLLVHGSIGFLIYGICLWQALHCLRKPQEAVININNMHAHNGMRKVLARFAHGPLFPLTLFFGFLTAGTMARHACNTYPMVGSHVFLTKNHFQTDIPMWKNFTENKLVVQVMHRTFATLFVLVSLNGLRNLAKVPQITKAARNSLYLIGFTLVGQLLLGITAIWYPEPLWLGVCHQGGALIVIGAVTYGLHTCRRVDPRHIKNLLGKLKVEDPQGYRNMMKDFQAKMSGSEGRAVKEFYQKYK